MEEKIRDLEERLRVAAIGSDLAALNELLAEDLIFTNYLGHRMSKADDLQAHKDGVFKIERLDPSEQEIRLRDGLALVSVRMNLEGKHQGKPVSGNFRFTRVWVHNPDGTWQVIAAHATHLG